MLRTHPGLKEPKLNKLSKLTPDTHSCFLLLLQSSASSVLRRLFPVLPLIEIISSLVIFVVVSAHVRIKQQPQYFNSLSELTISF